MASPRRLADFAVKVGFELNERRIALVDIQPLKLVSEALKQTVKYLQIASSIREVGIIEPPVVAIDRSAILRALLRWGGNVFFPLELNRIATDAASEVNEDDFVTALMNAEDVRTSAWIAAARAIIYQSFEKKRSKTDKLLEELIIRNPALLAFEEVWRAEPATIEGVLRRLNPAALPPELIRTAARMAFHSDRPRAAYYFLRHSRQAAVFGLMDAAEANANNFDYPGLCRLLEDYGEQAVEWLQQREVAQVGPLAVILEINSYDHRVLRSVTPRIWLPLANARSIWSSQVLIQCKTAILCAALNSSSWEDGGVLACGSFETVHSALANDNLPYRLWSDLRRLVPELDWSDNWDKAERLRQAILNAFSKHWPIDFFSM